MSWVDFFKQKIKEIAQGILPKDSQKIKILATTTTDSIIASALLIKTFQSLSHNFSCSFCKKITDSTIKELNAENSDIIFLINPQTQIKKLLEIKNKKIIAIESQSKETTIDILILSPQQFSQNLEVPASSLAYLFCKEIYPQINELSHLLPIPFFETDLEIPEALLNEAVLSKKLEVKKGITILISQTVPIHKAIANTLCPYLPGISGSEDNAIQLLLENEIPIRENSKFKKLEDLNEGQTKKLLTALMLKRLGSEKNPELLLGNAFLLTSEDDNSFIKDLKGFHFLIQSCLAYSKPSLALNICLNPKYKSKAYEQINNTQIAIVKPMEHYLLNKKSLTVEDSPDISIIKLEVNLDYKFLNLFAKISNNCNFLAGKFIAVSCINPAGQLLTKLEVSSQKNQELIPKIIGTLRDQIKFEIDIVNNDYTLIVPQDMEEALYNKLIISAKALKSNE